jgi:two-component system, NtrC family, sensor histidine kinase PilS
MAQEKFHTELNQYHLGVWYASYRLLIACCLILIFLLTYETLNDSYQFPQFYLYTLFFYAFAATFQLATIKRLRKFISKQLTLIFLIDVVCFSCLTIALDGPNLHISLLFVITIFAASLLLDSKKALAITLIAVISVIYQQFLGSLFDSNSLNNLSYSALLAVLFFAVFGAGQLAVKRFQLLETTNLSQYLELNRLQNINRYILEQIETGYLVLDEKCNVVLSNPAACHLLGIPPLYTHDSYPLIKLQPDLFELLKFDRLRNGEKFQFDSQLSRYHIHIQVQKLLVPHQTLTLLVLQDAQRLNQHVQQLKLAALGQLSASIAHEIRNPLAAIVQANELIIDSADDQRQLLSQMIGKQSQRIDRIVQDTLNMVRNKETHPVLLRFATFIPQFIAEDLADIQKQIKVTIQDETSAHFDEAQLRQILINLIRNAIRHNAPQASHIELNIYRHEQKVRLDVRDFGAGVSAQDQASLFQPFFSTEITGTGLGLYLSHSFCEANQAQLNYVQQEQGACFRITCQRVLLD